MLLNGPESFTLDGNFILGEAPEVARLLRLRRLQLRGHRQRRRRRPADRRMDRRRRAADRPLGRRHPPLRAVRTPIAGTWPSAPSSRSACTTRCAGRAKSSRPCGRCAARRSTTGWRRRAPCSAPRSTGSAPTISCRSAPRKPPYTLDTPGWLPWMLDEQRACREDVVVFDQTSFAKFVLKGRDALAVLERLCANRVDVAVGPHRLHGDAERARRLRERPHHHAARPRRILHPHRLGAGDARLHVDRATHRRRRARGARRRDERVFGAVGDGTARRRPAARAVRRRPFEDRRCRSRRHGRSTSATRACAPRG